MNDLTAEQDLTSAGFPEILARIAGDDPRLAQVAQLLALREQQAAERTSEGDDLVRAQEELAQALAREEEFRGRIEVLQRHAQEVADTAKQIQDAYELEASKCKRLEDVIERVSGGLGACPTCLGMEEYGHCELCHNRVGPGAIPPDPEDFQKLVLPAVRAHTYTRSRSRRDRPSDQKE